MAKVAYAQWAQFVEDLRLLHKSRSWTEVGSLFGKSGGWAEHATRHRSIVNESDVKRARVLCTAKLQPQPETAEEPVGSKRVHLQQHEQDEVVRLAAQLEKQYGTKLAVAKALGYSKSAWYRISQTGETLRKTLDKIRELAATASPTTNGTRPTEDVLPAQQEPQQVEKTTTPPPRREHSFEWLPRVQELLLEAAAVVENAKVGVPKAFHGPYNQFRSRIEGLLDELLAE